MDISKVTVTFADGSTKEYEDVSNFVEEHVTSTPETEDAPTETAPEAPAEDVSNTDAAPKQA